MGFGLTVEVVLDNVAANRRDVERQLRLGRRIRHALLGRSARSNCRPADGSGAGRTADARLRERRHAGDRRIEHRGSLSQPRAAAVRCRRRRRRISHCAAQTTPRAWTIVGAQIADGNGAPLRTGNVRIVGARIAAVGNPAPQDGHAIIDAKGPSPPRASSTFTIIRPASSQTARAESQVGQGITTVVLAPTARRRADPRVPHERRDGSPPR